MVVRPGLCRTGSGPERWFSHDTAHMFLTLSCNVSMLLALRTFIKLLQMISTCEEMTLVQAFGFLSDPGYFIFSAIICLYL